MKDHQSHSGIHNVKVQPITDQNINGLHPELRPKDHQYFIDFADEKRQHASHFEAGEQPKSSELPLQVLDININGLHTSLRAKDQLFYVEHPNVKQQGSELYKGPSDVKNGESLHKDSPSNKCNAVLPRSSNNANGMIDGILRSDNDNVRNERIEQYLNGLTDYRNNGTAFQATNNADL